MKTRLSLISILLSAALMLSTPSFVGAYRLSSAEPLPLEPSFVESLARDRALRGDLLLLLLLTADATRNTPAGLELRGDALSGMGLHNMSLEAYASAIGAGQEEPRAAASALEKYLLTARALGKSGVPAVPKALEAALSDRPALLLGSSLIAEGRASDGLDLLARASLGTSLSERVLAAASMAQYRAREGDLKAALSVLGSLRFADTSAYTDLYYLARGNLGLVSESYARARESFLAVPPGSLFYPEALYGLSWTHIRTGDLTGAAVRLSELANSYPYYDAANEAVLDLALCHRDLGLYDLAGEVLSTQMRRLSDYGGWMRSIQPRDLSEGGDLLGVVLAVIGNRPPDAAVLERLPAFALAWARRTANDAELRRITSLLEGIRIVDEARGRLNGRLETAIKETDRQVYWTALDMKAVEGIRMNLESYQGRLPVLGDSITRALDFTSLERFSNESAGNILSKIASLESRLDAMESSVEKSEGFSAVIAGLSTSVTTREDEQLLRIRRQAYEGLMSTRDTIAILRSDLRRLTGKVWLGLKMEAIRFQEGSSGVVSGSVRRTENLLGRAQQVNELLESRLASLRETSQEFRAQSDRLGRAVNNSLADLKDRTVEARTARLMEITASLLEDLELTEARTMYTAADVETTRMQELLRAMQEALP